MKRRYRAAVWRTVVTFLLLAFVTGLSVSQAECERIAGAHSRACTD